MSATAVRPLFETLDEIPLRTRIVNPADHPAVGPLLAFLNNSRRTVGETVAIVRGWSRPRNVNEDDFAEARINLFTSLLIANQETILAELHRADGYESLREVVCSDDLWQAHVAHDSAETERDVTWSAAQTIAVILLSTVAE